jgi:hypothetical protein
VIRHTSTAGVAPESGHIRQARDTLAPSLGGLDDSGGLVDWQTLNLSEGSAGGRCLRSVQRCLRTGAGLGEVLGGLDLLPESRLRGIDEPRGSIDGEPGHGFLRNGGRAGETPVGSVALEREDELLPRVVQIAGDHMQVVCLPAAGHADVDAGGIERVPEYGVRLGYGRALDAVGDGGVGQVSVIGDVLAGESDGAQPLAAGGVLLRPQDSVVVQGRIRWQKWPKNGPNSADLVEKRRKRPGKS